MGALDLRKPLVAALAADLIGPYAAGEVLRLPPSRWYLTGFLVPKTVRDSDERDPTDDDEMGAGNDETRRRRPAASCRRPLISSSHAGPSPRAGCLPGSRRWSSRTGKSIFEPLQVAMRERGVEARIFLHIDDRPSMSAEAAAHVGTEEVLRNCWPSGDPVPAIYYDPRTVAPGSSINLHAKCVVVDERNSLIGSANFTHNAHVRSIEVGVLGEDVSLATELTRQWQGLVDAGLVVRAPATAGSATHG